MVDCPNPDCREDLIKNINTKTKELRCVIANKVSTKALILIISIGISCASIISGLSYTAYSRSQDEKAKQIVDCNKSTQTMKTNVAVMQRDLEDIKGQLEKQGLSQEKVLDILMDMKRSGVVHTH